MRRPCSASPFRREQNPHPIVAFEERGFGERDMRHRRLCPVMLLALILGVLPGLVPAAAEDWPTRPIKFIVTQGAGGTPDLICRAIGVRLSRALGQQIVVENRPGGGNIIGAQAAARAAP